MSSEESFCVVNKVHDVEGENESAMRDAEKVGEVFHCRLSLVFRFKRVRPEKVFVRLDNFEFDLLEMLF